MKKTVVPDEIDSDKDDGVVDEIIDIEKLERMTAKGNKRAGVRATMLKKAKQNLENFRRHLADEQARQEQERPEVNKPWKPKG